MILHLKSHLIHSRNSSKACLVASCCILRFASPIPSSWKDDMKSSGFDQFSSKAKDYRMSVHASSIKWPDGERLNENYVHFSTADLDYGQRYDALWNLQNMTLNSSNLNSWEEWWRSCCVKGRPIHHFFGLNWYSNITINWRNTTPPVKNHSGSKLPKNVPFLNRI